MKICVIGAGYVGLSNACLLARQHQVVVVDVVASKIEQINQKQSPIKDSEIEAFFANEDFHLTATQDLSAAAQNADYVIIATPTDYDKKTNFFNTSSVETVLKQVTQINPNALVIVRSTIPVGFMEGLQQQGYNNVIFVPEFLREGRALYDNLHPSRIVIGEKSERAQVFAQLLVNAAIDKDVPVLFVDPTEAESIKLFANTYLAMRVAYFNELDSYALSKGLNSQDIIDGVTSDPRIGKNYCNPSFGYGGYCLPKDTKQLLANYHDIPQSMITGIVKANQIRKDFITEQILQKKPKTVGIYRLIMKTGSDNFRASSIQGISRRLCEAGVTVVVYEPQYQEDTFYGCEVIRDVHRFFEVSDVVVSNRWHDELLAVKDKVFTRDIFGNN